MKQRVFVGLEIPEAARQRISAYIETLRNGFPHLRVGWEKAEKLHLTLKFLGEIEDRDVTKLVTAAREAAAQLPAFTLRLTETGVFPKPAGARILWIGIKDETKNLLKLNTILESECEKRGFRREARSFKPHLTIARLREPAKSSELAAAHLRETFEPVEFSVSEIIVFRSVLHPTGSVYSKIGAFPLKVKNE